MKRGEIWWADLGPYRSQQQTGRRPVIVWQSDRLTRLLQSVLVVPLTTNLDRGRLAGTALIAASEGPWARNPWHSPSKCGRFPNRASRRGSDR